MEVERVVQRKRLRYAWLVITASVTVNFSFVPPDTTTFRAPIPPYTITNLAQAVLQVRTVHIKTVLRQR